MQSSFTGDEIMFKLVRLAVYALIGYGVYYFVTDVIEASKEAQAPSRGRGQRAKAGEGAKTGGKRKVAGKAEATQDVDGGSTRHRVGRGVV
jgi:hypothetical protein